MNRPNLLKELLKEIDAERFDMTAEGIAFPRQDIGVFGEYFDRVNGGEWSISPNRVPLQGLVQMLNVALGTTAKPAGFYMALFSGSATPGDDWTAANFAANANEIVSQTEGYTNATRPVWTPANTAIATIDNAAAIASVTFATTGTVTVTGAALLTNSTRGGTTGVLMSASKYPAARSFQAGDTYDVGYRFGLTI